MSATFDVIETRKRSGTDDWEVQIKRRDRAPSYGPGQRHQQNEGWWVTHEEITDERFGAQAATLRDQADEQVLKKKMEQDAAEEVAP